MIGRRIHRIATRTIEWAAKLGFTYPFHGLVLSKPMIGSQIHSFATGTLEWAAKLRFRYPIYGLPVEP